MPASLRYRTHHMQISLNASYNKRDKELTPASYSLTGPSSGHHVFAVSAGYVPWWARSHLLSRIRSRYSSIPIEIWPSWQWGVIPHPLPFGRGPITDSPRTVVLEVEMHTPWRELDLSDPSTPMLMLMVELCGVALVLGFCLSRDDRP